MKLKLPPRAAEYGKLFVVTGPVFVNNLGTIGNNKVTVPGYFYKVLMRFTPDDKVKTIGFILPNLAPTGELEDYIVPVNLVETITGLDFFTALASSIENRNEAQYEPGSWGFKRISSFWMSQS